jgi:hypothetical protein
MRNLYQLSILATLAACGGGSDEPAPCNPVGAWSLTETSTAGDCDDLGAVDPTALVLADAGDVFTAQIREGETLIECTGEISSSCSGVLTCSATLDGIDAAEVYSLAFAGDGVTGTAELSAAGEDFSCSGHNTVSGRR